MFARLAIVMMVVALSAPGAVFSLTSDFNSGTNEGWNTLLNNGFNTVDPCNCAGIITAPIPGAGGIGNSPFLEVTDTANGFLWVAAPSSWSGDLYGGNFSFYLRNENPNNYAQGTGGGLDQPTVRIAGTNGTVLYYFNLPGARINWTLNQLTLAEGPNWRLSWDIGSAIPTPAQVAQTLIDVASIAILTDWVSGYGTKPGQQLGNDITGLDNVSLIGVPEPSTALLLAGGLLSLLALRKRV